MKIYIELEDAKQALREHEVVNNVKYIVVRHTRGFGKNHMYHITLQLK